MGSMLVSRKNERDQCHGLPDVEYRALFAAQAPLSDSQVWIGRVAMNGWGARVTPVVVQVGGVPVSDMPQG